MGTNNIDAATDGTVIPPSQHNSIKSALSGDYVPRNASGVPEDEAGDLGTSSFQFKKARIINGYLSVGDIKPHFSFNNTLKCGQGWFPCNGSIINEANYDAYHGVGSWDEYIVTSLLEGKYSPSMAGKYLVGIATTTQTGVIAITPVGNTSHQVNLQHTHAGPSHNHQWYSSQAVNTNDKTYDSNGSAVDVPPGTSKSGSGLAIPREGSIADTIGNSYTSNSGTGTTGNGGSTTQNIQPESIQVEYYIRIVE
jgi:hypothetical protein